MSVGIARRIAEVLLGPWTFRRRLPAQSGGGVLVVSGRVGGLKYLLKKSDTWDPELLNIAKLLVSSGDVVWDIGANVGLFSKAAAFFAGANGQVLSIEADLDAVALLNRTCTFRSDDHACMTVLPVAMSDSAGIVRFAIAKRARASNSIEGFGSTQTGGVKEIRTLPSTTLDRLMDDFRSPNVLKIDVEGAERRVLRGAGRLLSEARPVIYCEVRDDTRVEVAELLEAQEYTLWDGFGFVGITSNNAISARTTNVVAIPNEKRATSLMPR